MSIFQILLIVSLVLIFTALALICGIILYYVKLNKEKNLILSHRELWKDYINDKDLVGVGLLSNNNGRGGGALTVDPEKMTEKQYRFLVLFLNHMEYFVPYKKYQKDWVGLFKNPCLRRVYEKTKLYRKKRFCKLIDSIILSYED